MHRVFRNPNPGRADYARLAAFVAVWLAAVGLTVLS